VPKLKAVCNRLLQIEDTHRYAVKIVDLTPAEKLSFENVNTLSGG
jgi:DNA-directed RNA polymerase subunit F